MRCSRVAADRSQDELLLEQGEAYDEALYEALSTEPDKTAGHKYYDGLYRDAGRPVMGHYNYTLPFPANLIDVENPDGSFTTRESDVAEIAYTQAGKAGPLILFLHGVPTNRWQWWEVQKKVASFARTIAIDMLGMGESDKPLNFVDDAGETHYLWRHDVEYIVALMEELYPPGEKFFAVMDDWGGGINTWLAALHSDLLLGHIQLNPIAFDGYPVREIMAIGRTAGIKSDAAFAAAMGAFDQTLTQIYKTMVHHPDEVYNQYTLRQIQAPYAHVDYSRSAASSPQGNVASSMSLGLKMGAIRVLAERSALLGSYQLLPYHSTKNPTGVPYNRISVPTLILWGEKDNVWVSLLLLLFFSKKMLTFWFGLVWFDLDDAASAGMALQACTQ